MLSVDVSNMDLKLIQAIFSYQLHISVLCHQNFFCSYWQSSHTSYRINNNYIEDNANFNPTPQEFTCLLLTSCEPRSTSEAYPTITNSGERTCLPDPFKRQKCGGCSCERPWCHGRCYLNPGSF